MSIKNAKNTPVKSDVETRSAADRWFIQLADGTLRKMTDADKPEEAVYHRLPRNVNSTASPEERASHDKAGQPSPCPYTGKKSILIACPQKQGKQDDAPWAVVNLVHPVIQRRQMIARERQALVLEQMQTRHGKAAAALWGRKVTA